MTVLDVLLQHGLDLGRRGRRACPLCQGHNPQEFSFTETAYYCFACGAKGGAWRLNALLAGRDPDRPVEGIRGGLIRRSAPAPAPATLAGILVRMCEEAAEERAWEADRSHRLACNDLRLVEEALWAVRGCDEATRQGVFEAAAGLARRAYDRIDGWTR